MSDDKLDDGPPDYLFDILVARLTGIIVDEIEVTRSEMMNLFDELTRTAKDYVTDHEGTVESVLRHVIDEYPEEKLKKYVRDLRKWD